MSEYDFSQPQRQSREGILLIFGTTIYQLARGLWVLGVSLLIADTSTKVLFFFWTAIILCLILALVYSVLSYRKFRFHINEEKGEFTLEKGVFSSEVISIPFDKIQQVNYKRNLLQRIIGVYSLVLDTAGSKEKEIEIKALSKGRSLALGDLLMKLAAKEKTSERIVAQGQSTEEGASSPQILWKYKLHFTRLLRLGLTSNYFRGLAILFAFYFSLEEQFQISEQLVEIPNPLLLEVASQILVIGLLILVGILLTLAETFMKYYGLTVVRTTKSLQVEMGLKENTKVSLRPQRVQLLQILTNPLQQRLNLYKMKISLASSQEQAEKDKIKIPGLPIEVVEEIKSYFYATEIQAVKKLFPHKMYLFRRIFRVFLLVLIGILAVFLSSLNTYFHRALWIGGAFFVFMLWFHIRYFKSVELSISPEFLVKQAGVWIREKQVLEMYKLQGVSIAQPLWYRKRGIVNLTFHTAGGDVRFNFVDKDEATALRNYLLFKIEASQRSWM